MIPHCRIITPDGSVWLLQNLISTLVFLFGVRVQRKDTIQRQNRGGVYLLLLLLTQIPNIKSQRQGGAKEDGDHTGQKGKQLDKHR